MPLMTEVEAKRIAEEVAMRIEDDVRHRMHQAGVVRTYPIALHTIIGPTIKHLVHLYLIVYGDPGREET